jgi:hypothetical protein
MPTSKTFASKRPLKGRFQARRVCGRAVPVYAINWQPSQAGTYRITAKAVDVGGLKGVCAEHTVTVNDSNTAPAITNLSPGNNAKYNATNRNPGRFTPCCKTPRGYLTERSGCTPSCDWKYTKDGALPRRPDDPSLACTAS